MNQRRMNYTNEYIDGNTVRKTMPQKQHPQQHKRAGQADHERQRNRRALPVNGTSVFFMGVVFLACIFMCVLYLNVQSGISAARTSISSLKNQINTVQSQNDALNYSINSYIDTDYIYNTAKKELGMKQAGEDQIVTYHSSDSGYMVQYGDIPVK